MLEVLSIKLSVSACEVRHEPVRAGQKIQKTATKIDIIFDAFFPMFSI